MTASRQFCTNSSSCSAALNEQGGFPCSPARPIDDLQAFLISLLRQPQLLSSSEGLQQGVEHDADRPLRTRIVGVDGDLHASGYHPDRVGDEDVRAASQERHRQ